MLFLGEQLMWLKVHSHGDIPVFGTEDMSSWIPIEPLKPNEKMTGVEIALSAYVNDATNDISGMR